MVLYGRILLHHEPDATTELLIDLCSGQLGKKPLVPTSDEANGTKEASGSSGPAMLSYLGVNRVTGLFTNDGTSSSLPSTSEQIPAQTNGEIIVPVSGLADGLKDAMIFESNESGPAYTPPSPRQFFAHFVDHHAHFVRFLEKVAAAMWRQSISPTPARGVQPLSPRPTESFKSDDPVLVDQRAVWNTLLELHLASIKSTNEIVAKVAQDKALRLLADRNLPFDPVHAMILCSTAHFTDGLMGLWESMGMYEDILRYWIEKDTAEGEAAAEDGVNGHVKTNGERNASDEVLRYLDIYGPTHPHLYPIVLRYLTSSPLILSRHSSQLPRLLSTINEERIMPPLAVVQLLSRNGVASIGSVKEWLRAKVTETRQEVESDKHLVTSYRTETAIKEQELVALANPAVPEVFQVTRCAACGMQLDLPCVHFMCKHSYHQRSVGSYFYCTRN